VQICPAHAERIPDVLIRTSSVSVKRDGETLNSDACHIHAFLSIDALYVQPTDSAEESVVEQAVTMPAVADPTAR
jgi:hypothetical protein